MTINFMNEILELAKSYQREDFSYEGIISKPSFTL